MKLKFYAFIFIILSITNVYSQPTQYPIYLSSPTDLGYFCGDRYIYASMDVGDLNNSNSENKLFLELFSRGVFQKIQAFQVSMDGRFGGMFELPDTLRIGEEYLVRMSSTNPEIISQTKKFIFGLGKLFYDVSFQEKNVNISSNEYSTKVRIMHSKYTLSDYHPSYYTLVINNNLRYNISEFDTSITLFVKDSIEKFKITSIENQCGFKGIADSEITIQKDKFPNKIYLRNLQNSINFCPKKFPVIQLLSNFLIEPSDLKVELVQIENDKVTPINNFKLLDEKLTIILPEIIDLNKYYYLKVTHKSGVESNYLQFFLNKPNKTIDFSSIIVKDNYLLSFNRGDGEGSSSPFKFNELIINGKNYAYDDNNIFISLPIPQKDTTLVLQKASDECGTLAINESTVVIRPINYFILNAKPIKSEFCEGEIAEFDLSNISKDLQNNVAVLGFVTFSGYMYNAQSGKYDGKYINHNIRIFDIRLDWGKNKLFVNVPNSLAETIRNAFGDSNYRMSKVDLYVSLHSNTSTKTLFSDYISIPLNFAPYIRIIPQSIENINKGNVKIPIQIITSQKTEVTLSDNKKYIIDPEVECQNCLKYYGGNSFLNVQTTDNSVISILKTSNQCSVGKGVGSVYIAPTTNMSQIIIEADKVPSLFCIEQDLQIPFKVSADFDWSKYFLIAEIKYKRDNVSRISYSKFVYQSPFILTKKELENYKIFADNVEVRFYVYQQSNITSSTVSVSLLTKPSKLSVYNRNYSMKMVNGIEVYSVVNPNEIFIFQTDGSNSTFKINNTTYFPTTKEPSVSELVYWMNSKKDTSFVIQSVSNSCGTLQLNKPIKIIYEDLVFKNAYDITDESFIKSSNCSGSRRVISYSLEGRLGQKKDSVIVQLSKISKINNELSFFDVKTERISGLIYYTIPDTCSGQYAWRLRLSDNSITSKFQQFNSEIKAKPSITLIGGSREISNYPLRFYEFKYATNLPKSKDFKLIYSNGQTYTHKTFSSYQPFDDSQNYYYPNIPKNVPTTYDANYFIKEIYNECGVGFAEGEVRIKATPNLSFDIVNNKIENCAGDSIMLKINYSDNFPKDTVMGIFLHSIFKRNMNLELANFNSGTNLVSLKLPKDLLSREYYIQIRKKSRKNADYSLFFGYRSSDSSKVSNARKEFDSDMKYIRIYAPLRYELTGNYEIFEGQSAYLQLIPQNSEYKDVFALKDTISRYYGVYNTFLLSDGTKISSPIVNNVIKVNPLKTTVYQIASAKGLCGIDRIGGMAKVTVLPLQERRAEVIGFPYTNTDTFNDNWRSFYRTEYYMCEGTKDSIDVLVYGLSNDSELINFKVALSGKNGVDFQNIKTDKFKIVRTLTKAKLVRFYFELPTNLLWGYNYKMKVTTIDGSFLSNIIEMPISIYEKPTASIIGPNSILSGENVNLQIKFTGDAPWFFTVLNENNDRVFSTIPTKADSLNQYKNFDFKPNYSEVYNFKLTPTKATTYKVSEVYNYACKWGNVVGNPLVVELITSNENVSHKIKIMPNPVSERVFIDLLDGKTETTVTLLSIDGKKITEKIETSERMEVDVSGFQTGTYLLKIMNGSTNKTYRISKQ